MSRLPLVVSVVVSVVAGACGKDAAPPTAGSAGGTSTPTTTAGARAADNAAATTATPSGSATGVPPNIPASDPVPQPEDPTLGTNIALAALGGHVVSPANSDDPTLRVANLLDGFPVIRGLGAIETSRGWLSLAPAFPHTVVIAFREDRQATITAAVIDTAAEKNLADPSSIPKDIELLISSTSATDGFVSVAKATLPKLAGETVIKFAPTSARWVKLVIASTHGGAAPQLGELQIFETADAASVTHDVPRNLLLPALGGSLVRFSSQADDMFAAELVDGMFSDDVGWSSRPGLPDDPVALPQELTFAFRDDRSARIDRVVIDPRSGMRFYAGPRPNMTTWPKTIELMSSDSPRSGFTLLATVAIPPVAKPVTVPIGKTFRYLKVRITENNGGDRVTLGEIQAIEGAGTSIVTGRRLPLERAAASAPVTTESFTRREREPNNTPAQADKLTPTEVVGGSLTPEGDRDLFAVPGAATRQTVTVALEGQPVIRTKVSVAGFVLEPRGSSHTSFSVVTGPGDLSIQVEQPPSAQVVIWDTSGSMEQRVADLDVALRQYLGQVKPTERVQLIRFDNTISVLLEAFSGDSKVLVAALKDMVYADGGTAIYDAIQKGLEVLAPVTGNRAIVIMTDGEDTSSTLDPAMFWQALDDGHTRVYTIGLGNGLRSYVARAGATAAYVLSNIAIATGGRYTYVEQSSQLARLYTEIGEQLGARATYAIAARTSAATGTLAVKAIGDRIAVPPRVELVLDASGSMKRAIGGKPMMDIAKRVMTDLVTRLPAGAKVALRVYGQTISEKQAGACEDSQLVVPFGPLDRPALTATIKRVRALGTTPIAYSIKQAGADLREAPGPAMLIVVTDGREECKGDPAAEVAALRASGLDVTLNIVGFGLTDPADRATMAKVATAGGGSFLDAQDETALRAAIDKALAVPYTVVDATGAIVGRGIVGGDPITVPDGVLAIRLASAGSPIVIEQVPIVGGQQSVVELTKDGERVGVRIIAPARKP